MTDQTPKNESEPLKDAAELAQTERTRRVRALVGGVLAVVVFVGGFIFIASNRDTFFEPKLDIESGQENILDLTNDPQCRGFIDEVTLIGRDFSAIESGLEKGLLTAEGDELAALIKQITQMRERVSAAKTNSADASLRFDESRQELEKWFKHVDLELLFLQRLGEERMPTVDDEQVEGTVVSDKRKKKSKKTPEERLDGALLATNEAFESFRVWHTGGYHPCGKADEDETPWKPPADKKTDQASKESPGKK